eukprot:TRINITY_DN6572_c0_g1_i2.p1 TRINITY_DN6572_c0_g1~~TRINITY_DN6572_c0_g1_i2.p1  ORF type:complete len:265 (+),score=60.09 TRINITY_DN6572_c0_g1_i2:79-873(+)
MGDVMLTEADAVKTGINAIRNNVKTLETQYKQALFAITPEQTNKSGQEISRLTDATNKQIHQVKAQLDSMRKTASGDHMKHNMTESLTAKFAEILQQYQKSQTEYSEKIKAKMVQKFKIAKPDASMQEIEEAIQNGTSDKIFAQQQLDTQHLHGQAKNALSYINDRHREVLQIQSSVAELNQLFLDMAILVESQGAILNTIEDNVTSAVENTKGGAHLLGKAVQQEKKSRKKMWIIIGILLVLICVILASTIGAVFSRQHHTDA